MLKVVKVLLQLFNKSKLRNGTKTFLEPKFLFIVKFKKLWFSTPLRCRNICRSPSLHLLFEKKNRTKKKVKHYATIKFRIFQFGFQTIFFSLVFKL